MGQAAIGRVERDLRRSPVAVVHNVSDPQTRIPILGMTAETTTRIPKMGTTKKEKTKTMPMTTIYATIPTMGVMTQMPVITHADPTKATASALVTTTTV
jgi:hypothetical protein